MLNRCWKTLFSYSRWILLTFCLVLLCPRFTDAQQGGATRYVYDDNGRLHAVIAPNGEANVYEYDAAGNFTAIRRNTATTLEVLGFTPRVGVPGTQVTIVGTGLGGGVSAVAFNGAAAQIVSVNAPVVVATVPNGVTTGPITLTTPQGSAASAQPFMVKGVQLTPTLVSLNPGQTQQFTAAVFPTGGSQSVTWSVNEIDGGNSTVGTISAAGLYTAPAAFFSALTVRATSVATSSLFSEAQVMVGKIDTTAPRAAAIGAGVLIQRAPPANPPTTFTAIGAGVLIQRAPVPNPPTTFTAVGAGVLIQRAAPANPPTTFTALGAGVLVQRQAAAAPSTTLTAIGAGVTTKTGPHITAITPGQVARGATLTLTITGANLTGVTTLRFSNGSGGVDTNLTASNVNVNGGGTSLTATLAVSGSAALGRRLVVVSTASASSLTFDNGPNAIEIVP